VLDWGYSLRKVESKLKEPESALGRMKQKSTQKLTRSGTIGKKVRTSADAVCVFDWKVSGLLDCKRTQGFCVGGVAG
jgi:hypothetical protein